MWLAGERGQVKQLLLFVKTFLQVLTVESVAALQVRSDALVIAFSLLRSEMQASWT